MSDDRRPIDKVPTEVLCQVFLSAAEFPYTTFNPSHLIPHHANLILLKITAVCKRWRSTASDCAMLWTNIAFCTSTWSTIQCAKLFLSRSKQAALSVYIWDFGLAEDLEIAQSSSELLKSLSAQTHRISICQLSSPSPDFWRYWTSPAPNLRKLLVQGHGPAAPPVFGGEFPQLEVLASQYCTAWPLGGYATLTHAELQNHNRHVALMSLLDTLGGCAALEGLILDGYRGMEEGVFSLAPICLPRLQQIELISCDSALILEHLETPSLEGPVVVFNPNPQRDILRLLPTTQPSTPYLQGVTSLVIDLNTQSLRHYVAGFRGGGSTAFYLGACEIPSWARWNWIQLSFTAMASFAPLPRIRSFTLVTDVLVVPWDLWLPNLSSVEELTVSCPRPDSLLAFLGFPPNNTLPSLHDLTIDRRGRYSTVDHSTLMQFVLNRYRVARPLRQLRLHREEWEWFQSLDLTWVLLAQSQRKCGRSTTTCNTLMHS